MIAMVAPSHEAQMNAGAEALRCFVEALEAFSAAEKAAWEVGRSGSRQAGATDTGRNGSDEEVA